MKKILLTILVAIIAISFSGCNEEKKPKYVFYFIGDGMGLNIIHAAELYKATQNGATELMPEALLFSRFPVVGVSNTTSTNSYITDSAAAGTALATGQKTSQGTIGMDADHKENLTSIAKKAKEKGIGVAVVTSVSIDHATPAAFYANSTSRNNYYEIAFQGASSNIDILGGSGFLRPTKEGQKNVYDAYKEAGYTQIKGKSALSEIDNCDTKILITERDGISHKSLSMVADRTDEDLTLKDLVAKSTEYLYKKYKEEGFMVVAEGGQIDWASHASDVNAAVQEVIDLDNAIEVAYNFYLQHPEETLIVITSDHETGGFGNANGGYELNFSRIVGDVKIPSRNTYAEQLLKAMKESDKFEDLPLPGNFKFTEEEIEDLEDAYEDIIEEGDDDEAAMYEDFKSDYAIAVYNAINDALGVGWTTGGHSGSPVMIYSIGAASDKFSGYKDNTEIPKIIEKTLEIQ